MRNFRGASGTADGCSAVNYVRERRRPVATAHLANDRLTLPWHPLEDAHSATAILVPWLLMSAALLFAAFPDFAGIRDLSAASANNLASWPLLALFVPLNLVLPTPLAAAMAMAAIPLLQLLMALVLVRGALRCLEFQGAAANIGLAIVPLLPLAVASFTPLKGGAPGWEAVLALAILRLVVDRRNLVRNAALIGACAAATVAISPVGVWLTICAASFFGVLYLREGRGECLAAFLAGLALSGIILFVLVTPMSGWAAPTAGHVGYPHLASAGAAALVAWLLGCLRRPPAPLARLAVLGLVIAVAVAGPVAAFGLGAAAPIVPGGGVLPQIWAQGTSGETGYWYGAPAMVLATIVLWLVAVGTRHRDLARSGNARGWLAVSMLSGAMGALALVSLEAALLAQVLAIPLFGLLMRDALRVASRLGNAPFRVAATALALFALTPAGGSFTGTMALNVAHGRTIGWPSPIEQVAGAIGSIMHIR